MTMLGLPLPSALPGVGTALDHGTVTIQGGFQYVYFAGTDSNGYFGSLSIQTGFSPSKAGCGFSANVGLLGGVGISKPSEFGGPFGTIGVSGYGGSGIGGYGSAYIGEGSNGNAVFGGSLGAGLGTPGSNFSGGVVVAKQFEDF